tara:strand:- start:589 stop:1116 length:528 start_codon:yes stop_codon:yes gene_type:complete
MARQKDDFYPTPSEATQLLLDNETFTGKVWECACGNGAMSKVLQENGYDVLSTDLNNYGFGESNRDFLLEKEQLAPNICTNPPFKVAQDFIEKCFELDVDKIAMFLRLSFLESVKRRDFFQQNPPVRVYVMSKRFTLWRGDETPSGSGITPYAWYVWERSGKNAYSKGRPTLWWL